MPGGLENSNLLKAALACVCMAAGASAGTSPGMSLGAGLRPASDSPIAPSSNRWVSKSKALACRGGADEPAETAEGIPGVLSEVEIAMSSFNEIVGDNLVEVDNQKKGTLKEVSCAQRDEGGVRARGGDVVDLVVSGGLRSHRCCCCFSITATCGGKSNRAALEHSATWMEKTGLPVWALDGHSRSSAFSLRLVPRFCCIQRRPEH